MRNLIVAALIVEFLTLAPSGALAQASPQGEHIPPSMPMTMPCPMKVTGTEVTAVDIADGISVSFVTRSGDVADLRSRVEAMAKMHNAENAMPGAKMSASAKYKESPAGGQVILTPRDPAKLEEVRMQVRQHVDRMKAGDCAKMQDMMGMKGMMEMRRTDTKTEAQTETKPPEQDRSTHHPDPISK